MNINQSIRAAKFLSLENHGQRRLKPTFVSYRPHVPRMLRQGRLSFGFGTSAAVG
jgi:hypothetical protein